MRQKGKFIIDKASGIYHSGALPGTSTGPSIIERNIQSVVDATWPILLLPPPNISSLITSKNQVIGTPASVETKLARPDISKPFHGGIFSIFSAILASIGMMAISKIQPIGPIAIFVGIPASANAGSVADWRTRP